MKKKVSVIIPTYNEEYDIEYCLKSLGNQSLKNIEIIVVDDGSTDKTREIVKKFSKVKLINGVHRGPGYSRNIGAKIAKGEILVFIDSDMEFEKDYIKNLVDPIMKNKKVIGTTHEQEIVKNIENIWSKCWGRIRVSKENAKKVKVFRAARKNEFLNLGGFDPKYGYADDQTFWFKYKLKPVVAPKTICYHRNPETLNGVYKQSRWIGASIDNKLTSNPILKYFLPPALFILSPILIPIYSIKKCYENKNFAILIPWMIIFIFVRYFGTINGLMRKIYLDKNFR
ncbi:glycosyltransferase family 2 protein [Candidatus Pacearchaeota archaeon]|nr:glycosyltransferase family 2 protein [Candidatus Pacearchaeota archaeon]